MTAPHRSGHPQLQDPRLRPRTARDRGCGWTEPAERRLDSPPTATPSGTELGVDGGTETAGGTPTAAHRRNERRPERGPTGTASRHGDAPERNDARSDDAAATHHHHHIVVPADTDDRAGADDGVPPGRLAGAWHRLIDDLRFVNTPLGSLRQLLRFAKEADYNLSHIAVVRAANNAFFWLVTAPVLTVVWFLSWVFVVRLHRALTASVIVLTAAPVVRTIPVIGWPVPDWLVVTTWSATTWQWVGGGALVFGVATAIASAGERRR